MKKSTERKYRDVALQFRIQGINSRKMTLWVHPLSPRSILPPDCIIYRGNEPQRRN